MDAHDYASTIRFSVFRDPENSDRALACVAESPTGSSAWHKIDLTKIYKPVSWEYPKLLYALSKEDTAESEAIQLGRSLFELFFAGDAAGKLATAVAAAPTARRLAIDCPKDLVDFPWELLHNGDDFLLALDWSIVRVVRELSPDVAYFGPVSSIALVTVTPDFDPSEHLNTLEEKLKALNVRTSRCDNPDRGELRSFLNDVQVDALYFLGHGSEGKILLRPSEGDSGWLDARDLAQWLPDLKQSEKRINLAYFSSCATALPQEEGSVFSGFAQRLMLTGKVGTVVAMQAKIELGDALRIAVPFFDRVVREGDPERALSYARTSVPSIGGRSIPVMYTHVRGPETFRKNRISRFLGTAPEAEVCVSLPGLVMGMKYDDYASIKTELRALLGDRFYYRGHTYAKSDVEAAKEFLDLLASLGTLNNVSIAGDDELPDCPTTFVFGSKSHLRSLVLSEEYGAEFTARYEERQWTIVDEKYEREYTIESPVSAKDYEGTQDFGFVEKAFKDGRCYFFVSGLGDRATRGCAYYVANNWERLLAEHLDRPFGELFRFPGGLPATQGERLDRANNPYATSTK